LTTRWVSLQCASGCRYTIRELAMRVAAAVGKEWIEPELTGKYRVGDIRHCIADITLARTYWAMFRRSLSIVA